MRFVPVLAAACLALLASVSFAPAQQPPRREAIDQLLAEVHQLRLVLERQATVGARVQLLGSRLALQDDRVYKLSTQLEATRRELASLERQIKDVGMREQQFEEMLELSTETRQRQELEMARKMMKSELAAAVAQQETLRVREQELANSAALEQAKLDEVTRRLDDLDRLLEGGRP